MAFSQYSFGLDNQAGPKVSLVDKIQRIARVLMSPPLQVATQLMTVQCAAAVENSEYTLEEAIFG